MSDVYHGEARFTRMARADAATLALVSDAEQVEELRRAVARLEAENAALARRTEEVVHAHTRQARALDVLDLDLNRLLQRRGVDELRAVLRAARRVYWLVRYRPLQWWRYHAARPQSRPAGRRAR
jgi:hypothetical protein